MFCNRLDESALVEELVHEAELAVSPRVVESGQASLRCGSGWAAARQMGLDEGGREIGRQDACMFAGVGLDLTNGRCEDERWARPVGWDGDRRQQRCVGRSRGKPPVGVGAEWVGGLKAGRRALSPVCSSQSDFFIVGQAWACPGMRGPAAGANLSPGPRAHKGDLRWGGRGVEVVA
jgi:hypothetical protein